MDIKPMLTDLRKNREPWSAPTFDQALEGKRPCKDGISYEITISTMLDMAGKGDLKGKIVHEMDAVIAAKHKVSSDRAQY